MGFFVLIILVMVSAFGATDFPTSAGKDPVQVGRQLAQFVIDNQLDGVDLDWEDNDAMNAGKGLPPKTKCDWY